MDAWYWQAHLDDGSVVSEIDDQGGTHVFAEVDPYRVRAFFLIPRREGLTSAALSLTEGQRLVFFRRRTFTLNVAGGETYGHHTFHCLGWESDAGNSYTFLNESGAVLTTSDREAI